MINILQEVGIMKKLYQEYLPDFDTEASEKEKFQNVLKKHFKCNYAIGVCNGTVAIEVILKALKLQRGASVIVPELSFIATATAVANCGLLPVYADISDQYFGMTLQSLEKKYDPSIVAVIVVHLAGIVNRDINTIAAFCKAKNIYLIEDCAQAFPCSVNNKMVGTFGDAGTCSFQSSKIINCGEGGCIITNSESLYKKCETVANWGLFQKQRDLSIPSSNFRISSIQAYFITKQIGYLDLIINERIAKAKDLISEFKNAGMDVQLPDSSGGFNDCLFFVPVYSKEKINMIEPRSEYPMHKSTMVKTILGNLYPDLLPLYIEKIKNIGKTICEEIINEIDFVNIHNYKESSAEDVVNCYLEMKEVK
jgi:perosamine synthetase